MFFIIFINCCPALTHRILGDISCFWKYEHDHSNTILLISHGVGIRCCRSHVPGWDSFMCREFIEECRWISVCGRMKAARGQSQKWGASTVISRASVGPTGCPGAAQISVNPNRIFIHSHWLFTGCWLTLSKALQVDRGLAELCQPPVERRLQSCGTLMAHWCAPLTRNPSFYLQSIAGEFVINFINIHAWLSNFVEAFLSCLDLTFVGTLGLSYVFW